MTGILEGMHRAQRSHRTSCDECKRKKIRCDRQGDRCSRCVARNSECTVTFSERKKRQPSKKGDPLSSLEMRMKQLEAAITASGLDVDGIDVIPSSKDIEARAALSDKFSTLVIGEDGASQYVGQSSGFSLFSPHGLNWISRKTGNSDFANYILNSYKNLAQCHKIVPSLWRPLPESECSPLPPKETAESYLNSFFGTFNLAFPLYDQAAFIARYARQPFPTRSEDVPWYASLNIALAIGCLTLSEQDSGDSQVQQDGSRYFRNACTTLNELLFNDANLLAVQAMAGIAFMLQGTPEKQMYYMVTGAAARLAQSMGLHRRLQNVGLSDAELERRRNVFWIVYVLEKGSSSHLGRSSAIHDDDIAAELPSSRELGFFPDGSKQYDTFPNMVKLVLISSRVYNDLYCARAQTKPKAERLRLGKALEKEYYEWRDVLPLEIRPGHPIRCHERMFMPVITMHFAYHSCLLSLYQIPVQHISCTSEDEDNVAKPEESFVGHASSSVDVARTIIRLLHEHHEKYLSTDHIIRIVDYASLTALMALFTHTLHNPRNPNAPSDLELMSNVTRIISIAIQGKGDLKIKSAIVIFEKMTHVAALFVKQALTEDVQNAKRLSQTTFEGSSQSPITEDSESPNSIQPAALPITPLTGEPSSGATQIPFDDLTPASLMSWASDPSMICIDPSFTYQSSAPNDNGMASQLPLTDPSRDFDFPSSFVPVPEESGFMMNLDGTSMFPMTFQWDVAELWMGRTEQGN